MKVLSFGKVFTLTAVCSLLAMFGQSNRADRLYTNQADIKVVNAPTSDGTIVFDFEPDGGIPQRITVQVQKHWPEGSVAREIERVFNEEVGANYKVTWNNKRKVTITKRSRKRKFLLGNVEYSAKGVTVKIDYD
ncbi:MAG TPA: hypothetical protein VGG06_33605 [Thermoanaerobaculia bacterium]|jgi:hypothetical protein